MITFEEVDEILWNEWDPIGVKKDFEKGGNCRDEYHSFIPAIVGMVNCDLDGKTIANFLYDVAKNHMGIGANRRHSMEVAKSILLVAK